MNNNIPFSKIPIQSIRLATVTVGLRQIGKGENLVFIHGFPTHGNTWRKLIPDLSKHFSCHIFDLPGLGESDWSKQTDFSSGAQAGYVLEVLKTIGVSECSILAHNSGATVAREMALRQEKLVRNLIMFNTEIPNHRPPWIPFYQKIGLLPLVPGIIRQLLKSSMFISSPMGFKELYSDKSLLNSKENTDPYLLPIINSNRKTKGAFRYLKGIDWKMIDAFENTHAKITANVLFLWGEDDKTFPVQAAKEMVNQFKSHCQFVVIKDTSLLPHEEKPKQVLSEVVKFLKVEDSNNRM